MITECPNCHHEWPRKHGQSRKCPACGENKGLIEKMESEGTQRFSGRAITERERIKRLEAGIDNAIEILDRIADGIDPDMADEFTDPCDLPRILAAKTARELRVLVGGDGNG